MHGFQTGLSVWVVETQTPHAAMKNTLTHKEMTNHIRARIAASGIKARVMMRNYCGISGILVVTCAHNVEFSDSEQREIRIIAKTNKLTYARGTEIDVERMTDPSQHSFEFHA